LESDRSFDGLIRNLSFIILKFFNKSTNLINNFKEFECKNRHGLSMSIFAFDTSVRFNKVDTDECKAIVSIVEYIEVAALVD
jgi:hypothetical protein